MSSEVSQKARQTLKSLREILEKAESSAHDALEKAAPVVQRSLDLSMETAMKGFIKTMKTIDGATAGDQVKLLKAYRNLLGGQIEFVDARIRSLQEKP